MTWFQRDKRPVYWLNGLAGTGKSTIARTVADLAEARQQLGGCFFFSRTDDRRRQPGVVIPTLAYQLGSWRPELRKSICDAIAEDPEVATCAKQIQAKRLIADALRTISSPAARVLIVLDALDECKIENGREGGDLIPLLLDSILSLPFSVKILVTSRPEHTIKAMFSSPQTYNSPTLIANATSIRDATSVFALHYNIEEHVAKSDIVTYLDYSFQKIRADRGLKLGWPTISTIKDLAERAGTLFIYAATIVRFVADPNDIPNSRLEEILAQDASDTQYHYEPLDQLYKDVLVNAANIETGDRTKYARDLQSVVAVVVLSLEPLHPIVIACLATLPVERSNILLSRLSALVVADSQLVRIFHPSFPDCITDENRCMDPRFFVGPKDHHQITHRCLEVLNEALTRDICEIRDPSLFNSEVSDLPARLQKAVNMELHYTCVYWTNHLASVSSPGERNIEKELETFCTLHLLHWIELCSLLKRLPSAEEGLNRLIAWFEVCLSSRVK